MRRAPTTDVAIAGFVALVGIVETTLVGDYQPLWPWVLGAAAAGALLLARRRRPLETLIALLVVLALLDFTTTTDSDPGFPFFAVLIACFSVGAYASDRAAVAALALVLADYALGVVIGGVAADDIVFIAFVVVGAMALGRTLTERQARLERAEAEREAQARQAVLEERARIARELHDVVAHSMSMVLLQVGAVRRLLTDSQQREREALLGVEATGRQALGEMRRLLGIQRRAERESAFAPQPSLAQLDELVAGVREAGLPVEVRVEGDPIALPPGLDLSAYRIVQEALTNTLKHASAARADVHVRYGDGVLALEITDDGRGANGATDGAGHGLIGMRERVALYGGDLRAAPRNGGGWAVAATLPVERQA
jgi:MYXO-CTERM domain-containing protein